MISRWRMKSLQPPREELEQNVQELTSRETQLNDALAEKEILLSEIHHRVKNNLAAFISLLSLEGTYRGNSGRARTQERPPEPGPDNGAHP